MQAVNDKGNIADATNERQIILKGFERYVRKSSKARYPNRVRQLRIEKMMSKAELARRAGLSPITISRVEEGYKARLETKRKILQALGLSPHERERVFFDDNERE